MNEPAKYLIVMDYDCPCAIVFNSILSHRQVAGEMNVIAAGFCRLPDKLNDNVNAWGESTTLKVKSRGNEDADLILRQIAPQN